MDDFTIWDAEERRRLAYAEKHYQRCDCCGEFIERDEDMEWRDGEPICRWCFDDWLMAMEYEYEQLHRV